MSKKQEEKIFKELEETYLKISEINFECDILYDESLIELITLISKKKFLEAIELILDIRYKIEEFKINTGNIISFLGDIQWNGLINRLLDKYGPDGLIKKFGKILLDPNRPYYLRLKYST